MASPAHTFALAERPAFRRICGGSRARAYASTGDFLAEDPACAYVPPQSPGSRRDAAMRAGGSRAVAGQSLA
jgi:hypothetical protein